MIPGLKKGGHMVRKMGFLLFVVFLAGIFSCDTADNFYKDRFWVIADKANIYDRPSTIAQPIQELVFGDKIYCRDKNPSYTLPKGWVEVKTGGKHGYIEKKLIADDDIYGELKKRMGSLEDSDIQGRGIAAKKTQFRMRPDKGSGLLETFKEPKNVDVFERLVIEVDKKNGKHKEVWYKVRTDDGRVGYIGGSKLRLTPPNEINMYTQVRVPVSWYLLQEKEDKETGEKGRDYLVTYSSIGSGVDVDFTRIELYNYDLKSKQYSTSLAKSGLYGILPVKITEKDGGRLIEIREHPKGNRSKIHTMVYSFPSPIKIVNETTEDVE